MKMNDNESFFRVPVWYPVLAPYTWDTKFVKLPPEALQMFAAGCNGADDDRLFSPTAKKMMQMLDEVLSDIPGNAFVFMDSCAPTDTERFASKGGAVYSARSALKNLLESAKVSVAAQCQDIEYICVRPFRNITRAREFRLFIYEGRLSAMSQYHLVRHYRRLEGVKDEYWRMAESFINNIAWSLPVKTFVMDIYITSDKKILIVDLNPWGGDTDPLMLKTWDRDWSVPAGIQLMAPPTALSGDVKVSF